MTFRLPSALLVALLVAAIAVFVGLGVWQLQRNEWRNELVAERNARLDDGHVSVERLRAMPLEELDFRLIEATGTWDHEHTMTIANRARFQSRGEEIVTPLLVAPGGPAILVVRGWAPEELRDEVLERLAGHESAQVLGLVRYEEDLSARQTPRGAWSGMSPGAMGAALPYEVLPWFVIQGDLIEPNAPPPEELPAQGFLRYESHVPHMEYALTWFGIAAVLVAVALIRFVVGPRRQRPRKGGTEDLAAHEPAASRDPAGVDR